MLAEIAASAIVGIAGLALSGAAWIAWNHPDKYGTLIRWASRALLGVYAAFAFGFVAYVQGWRAGRLTNDPEPTLFLGYVGAVIVVGVTLLMAILGLVGLLNKKPPNAGN